MKDQLNLKLILRVVIEKSYWKDNIAQRRKMCIRTEIDIGLKLKLNKIREKSLEEKNSDFWELSSVMRSRIRTS